MSATHAMPAAAGAAPQSGPSAGADSVAGLLRFVPLDTAPVVLVTGAALPGLVGEALRLLDAGGALRRAIPAQVYLLTPERELLAAWQRASFDACDPAQVVPYCGTLGELQQLTRIEPHLVLLGLPADEQRARSLLRRVLPPRRAVAALLHGDATEAVAALQDWCSSEQVVERNRLAGCRRFEQPGRTPRGGLPQSAFAAARDVLVAEFAGTGARSGSLAERLSRAGVATVAGRPDSGVWPYSAPAGLPLPATLPGGRPWPRVSVITPSFNQGEYIEQTLLSVANQGYPRLEHIVIDGGSTDATRDVLARWRDRLAFCVSEKDRGQSHAINKGFERASGDLLMWLNSDDLLAPGALAAAALALHRTRADMVAGICEIQTAGSTVERHLTCCPDGPLPLEDLLNLDRAWMEGEFFYQPEVIFTRELWQRAGARVDEAWFYSMDYELWLRFAQAGARLAVIGRPIAQFRVHAEQKTNLAEKFRAELDRVTARFREQHGLPAPAAAVATPVRDALRIVFFNDIGYQAGAGLAHERLASACVTAGHEVHALAVSEGSTLGRESPVSIEAVLGQIRARQPDLVVLGNLHSAALPPELLGAIAAHWPTAYVMHDQWALTGRCAYTGGCEKYLGGCDDACPTPDEYPALAPERIAAAWKLKRAIYGTAHPPLLLANSAWMHAAAEQALALDSGPPGSAALQRLLQAVRLGVPTDVFRPRDRAACREHFDLPADRFIIMTSGTSAADPRKGLAHLSAALQHLALPDVLVVSVGHFDQHAPPPIPGMRAMGYLTDPRDLAMLYAAADIFVGPSLQEAFGQVFVEAAACGTPAVGYPVGGVPEAVLDGVSGRLANAVAPAALADAIFELYSDASLREELAAWGRMAVENEFSIEFAYRRLYLTLVGSGLRDRLHLRRKIRFAPGRAAAPRVAFLAPEVPNWRAVSGFDGWEGPYPHDDLPRCRWALGACSRFEFTAAASGPHLLVIECRNYWIDQRIRVVMDNQVRYEAAVPVTNNQANHCIQLTVPAREGVNAIELHHWQWDATKPQRPLALLILSIEVVPQIPA